MSAATLSIGTGRRIDMKPLFLFLMICANRNKFNKVDIIHYEAIFESELDCYRKKEELKDVKGCDELIGSVCKEVEVRPKEPEKKITEADVNRALEAAKKWQKEHPEAYK